MRYFFHVHDDHGVIADDEGSELPDLEAAHEEARASARDFAADSLRGGPGLRNMRIVVVDENNVVLETLSVMDVMG